LLYGIVPVVIAIIVNALWSFVRLTITGPFLSIVGLVALTLYFLSISK